MTQSANFSFELLVSDAGTLQGSRLTTPRGTIELPTFMPVGTLGTVKGLTVETSHRPVPKSCLVTPTTQLMTR